MEGSGKRASRQNYSQMYGNAALYVYVTSENKSQILDIVSSNNMINCMLDKKAKEYKGLKIERIDLLGKTITFNYNNGETSSLRGKAYKQTISKLKPYSVPVK